MIPARQDADLKAFVENTLGENISTDAEIERLHASLSTQFSDLRAVRPHAPIYLIEHGLDSTELHPLLVAVREALHRYHIGSGWWERHPLPLLVAATEIGYVYRGTGTDFWPIFAETLHEVTIGDRAALSSLFRKQVAEFGLAQPADSSWNIAFCHIAWPVLHAILPVELHRSLAETLRDIRSVIDLYETDAELVASVRKRAQVAGGVRLNSWLEEQHTAAAVIRQVLDPGGEHRIAGSALRRIAADLARDEFANAALREARIRQRALVAKPTQRTRRRGELPPLFAPLVLRFSEHRLGLALKIPQMEQSARELARGALDAMRWRAYLWGEGRPVPGRNIFSDFPLPLQIDELPKPDLPLFSDLNALPITQDAKEFLESLRVATDPPLLFSDFGPDDEALQHSWGVVSDSSNYVVLVSTTHGSPPVADSLGRVAGLNAYRLAASDPKNTDWLTTLGFVIRQTTRFAWIGAAETEQHRPVRRYSVGSFVAFELNAPSGSCDTILICPDGAESTLTSTGTILAGFSASEKGLYRLKFSGGEEVAFEIVDDDDDPNIIKIDIDAGSRATSDLADRKVTLRFNSIASVQEAEIQLTLLCDGRVERHVQDILPDTPCRIDGSHSIWERLLDTDTVERLLGSRRAELFVEVSGLLKTSFAFDQVVAPFAWAKRPDGTMAAYDETGELMIFATTPEHPTKPSSTSGSVPEFDIQLLRAGRDQPSQAGGICIGSGTWRAGDALAVKRPERLMRQFSGESNNAVYGRDMVDALISWSAATVDNPVIQYRRGQIVRELENWLIEQFCGTAWSKQEQALNARRETSFIRSFLSACAQLGIGYGDVVVSASHDSHLNRILVRLIKTSGVFKKIEIDREPISEDIAIKLDDIFNEAYTLLYEELVAQGEPCSFDPDKDVDVGEISENWERAIARATSAEALPEMVALLRPLDAGDALSMADFEAMPPDEVIDLLDAWITKNSPAHHARNWNRDLVEAAYWLFTRPALVARLPWTTVTERLLADSFTARAIRYAALRAGSGSKFE